MFNVLADVPWLGTLAAVIAFTALGALYFVALVPEAYLSVMGLSDAPKEAQQVSGIVGGLGPILCIVVIVLTDAVLLTALGVTSITDAILFALITGVGYLLAMTVNIAINPLFPHPLRYGLLNAPFFVGGNVLASVLIAAIG